MTAIRYKIYDGEHGCAVFLSRSGNLYIPVAEMCRLGPLTREALMSVSRHNWAMFEIDARPTCFGCLILTSEVRRCR